VTVIFQDPHLFAARPELHAAVWLGDVHAVQELLARRAEACLK